MIEVNPKVILVCGGRDYTEYDHVYNVLDDMLRKYTDIKIVAGDASGADEIAQRWADHRGVPRVIYSANWHKYGKAAGPMRNQKMLANERPDLVIAFPGNRGTADMVERAREAGVEVIYAEKLHFQ